MTGLLLNQWVTLALQTDAEDVEVVLGLSGSQAGHQWCPLQWLTLTYFILL